MKQSQGYSVGWGLVIVALIVFWPVGIVLLIMKLANDRSASFGIGRLLIKIVGGVLLFIGIMMIFYGVDTGDMGVGIVLALLFGVPGLWLWRKAKQMKQNANKYRTYIEYVVNQREHDIDMLAKKLHASPDVIAADLNDMISRGMLGQARINSNTRRIEFPQRTRPKPPPQQQRPQQQQRPPQQRTAPVQQPIKTFEPRTIRCTTCGANNFVESLPNTCEYCGSSLHE